MTEKERKLIEGTSRYEFDSRVGIESKIEQEFSKEKATRKIRRKATAKRAAVRKIVEETAYLRRLYFESHSGEEQLVEFVVDGTYLLTRYGTLHRIIDKVPNKHKLPMVVTTDDFRNITKIGGYRSVESRQANSEIPKHLRKKMEE